MVSVSERQIEYGRLHVAVDGEVQQYALAPEATLADVGDIFASAPRNDPRRLLSVQITIVSEPVLMPTD